MSDLYAKLFILPLYRDGLIYHLQLHFWVKLRLGKIHVP